MTKMTAANCPSEHAERLYQLPLAKAQQLAQESRDLVAQVEGVLDRVAADHLLIGSLGKYDLEPDGFLPTKTDWGELAYSLKDVGTRLVEALEEVRVLVHRDDQREAARGIVAMARAEGRIPNKEVV